MSEIWIRNLISPDASEQTLVSPHPLISQLRTTVPQPHHFFLPRTPFSTLSSPPTNHNQVPFLSRSTSSASSAVFQNYRPASAQILSISPSDTMAEWSKAVDLSSAWISTTEMCVGSNPTRVILLFFAAFNTFLAIFLALGAGSEGAMGWCGEERAGCGVKGNNKL
jgi:hypothetical protein